MAGIVQIRFANPEDAPAIASVLAEAFKEYEPLYTAEAFAATTPTPEKVWDRMGEGPVWVALNEDSITGTVSALPQGEALYIRSLAVLPEAQGQGAGEALLGTVQRYAAALGYRRLFLSTTSFLTPAIRLYERFGFRSSTEGPEELFGTPLFTMVCEM